MAEKGAELQQILKTLETFLHAADVKKAGDNLVSAFRTIVIAYAAIKTDTESERAARTKEFVDALGTLRKLINTRLEEVRGTDGKDGVKGEKGDKGDNGKDGKSIVGSVGPTGKDGVDGSPDMAEDIVNKLLLLPDGEKLPISAIEGLREALDEIDKRITYARSAAGGSNASVSGRDIFTDIDLSAQLDGVKTTFDIPAVYNIVSVVTSSFPTALRKKIDFSYTPTSITFLGTIDPATQLQQGQQCILTVVTG